MAMTWQSHGARRDHMNVVGGAPLVQKERNAVIVDVNPLLLRIMEYWMHAQGDSVVYPCRSFKEAHDTLGWLAPDLLITEIRLGDFNGIHLALLVRNSNPDATIVVVSELDDPVLRDEIERLGARFLLKPLRRQALVEATGSIWSGEASATALTSAGDYLCPPETPGHVSQVPV